MKGGGLLVLAAAVAGILFVGVAFVELLLPVDAKARLDAISMEYSERAAMAQGLTPEEMEALVQRLSECGLEEIQVRSDDLSRLKRGESGTFRVQGTLSRRAAAGLYVFRKERFDYFYERALLCRRIFN